MPRAEPEDHRRRRGQPGVERLGGIRLEHHAAVIDQRALGDGSVRALVGSTKVNGGCVHSPSIMLSMVLVVVRHG